MNAESPSNRPSPTSGLAVPTSDLHPSAHRPSPLLNCTSTIQHHRSKSSMSTTTTTTTETRPSVLRLRGIDADTETKLKMVSASRAAVGERKLGTGLDKSMMGGHDGVSSNVGVMLAAGVGIAIVTGSHRFPAISTVLILFRQPTTCLPCPTPQSPSLLSTAPLPPSP